MNPESKTALILAAGFSKRIYDFSLDFQARACVRRRLGTALRIAERIEAVFGRSLEYLREGSLAAYTI